MITSEPYSSKNLKMFNINKTVSTVNEVNKYITLDYAYIKESNEFLKVKPFIGVEGELNTVILYGISESEKEILPLNHPFYSLENNWGVLDLRNYVKLSENKESYNIRNESEYRLALIKYILSSSWVMGKQSSLYSLELAHFSFASWLSDNLASKFGLDFGDKVRLRTLASLYYTRMFSNQPDSEELTKLLIRSKRDMVVPELLEEIYEVTKDMQTIDDFCVACFKVTGNVRLKGLDYTVLSNIISGNWLGSSGKELSLLALEHPPTWISLVYASLTQRSFKRNFITSVVEKLSKKGKDQEFVREVEVMSKNQLEE